MASLSWLLIVAFFGCACAEVQVANFQNCAEDLGDVCKVSEIRIDPCKRNKKCEFTKGQDASISFDFLPNFSSPKLSTGLYWDNGVSDVEFDEMKGIDACTLTSCPTEAGKSQTLNYKLAIGKKLPQGMYTFKWKLWNTDEKSQMCCFKTTVHIRKARSIKH